MESATKTEDQIFNFDTAIDICQNNIDTFQLQLKKICGFAYESVKNIEIFAKEKDFNNVTNVAHKLKGAAAIFGAERLARAADICCSDLVAEWAVFPDEQQHHSPTLTRLKMELDTFHRTAMNPESEEIKQITGVRTLKVDVKIKGGPSVSVTLALGDVVFHAIKKILVKAAIHESWDNFFLYCPQGAVRNMRTIINPVSLLFAYGMTIMDPERNLARYCIGDGETLALEKRTPEKEAVVIVSQDVASHNADIAADVEVVFHRESLVEIAVEQVCEWFNVEEIANYSLSKRDRNGKWTPMISEDTIGQYDFEYREILLLCNNSCN